MVFVIIEFIFATLLAIAAFLFNTTSNRHYESIESVDYEVEDGYSMEEDNIVLGKSLFLSLCLLNNINNIETSNYNKNSTEKYGATESKDSSMNSQKTEYSRNR